MEPTGPNPIDRPIILTASQMRLVREALNLGAEQLRQKARGAQSFMERRTMLDDATNMNALAVAVDGGEPRNRWLDYAIANVRSAVIERPSAGLEDPYLDAIYALFDWLTGHDTHDLQWNLRRMAQLQEGGARITETAS